MSGVLFYWFSWIGWAFITFLMKKGKTRTELGFLFLLVILFSGSTLHHPSGIHVCLSFIIIILYGYRRFASEMKGRMIYHLFACNVITLTYACFYIYSIFDPIIILGGRTWMLAAIVFLYVQTLVNTYPKRLIVALIGISHGNILYEAVTRQFFYSVYIGSLEYLDLLGAAVCLISVWHLYMATAKATNEFFRKSIQSKNQLLNKVR